MKEGLTAGLVHAKVKVPLVEDHDEDTKWNTTAENNYASKSIYEQLYIPRLITYYSLAES